MTDQTFGACPERPRGEVSPVTARAQPPCLRALLAALAGNAPEAVAIVAPGRAPLTYAGLYRHTQEVVRALNAMGLGRGDRIAIVLPNGPEMAVACLAVAAGATIVPLNPATAADELRACLPRLKLSALLGGTGAESPLREVARRGGIPVLEASPVPEVGAGAFRLVGERRNGISPTGFGGPDDLALVLLTSGSTSRPKIVPLTHRNILAAAANTQAALGLTERDRCLNVMPLFHGHGLVAALLASMMAGGSVACAPGFNVKLFFDWIEAFRPTWYTAAPTIHQEILAEAVNHRDTLARHPLRFIRSASAHLPGEVQAALEQAFGVLVTEGYGLSEALQLTNTPLDPRRRKPGSLGVAGSAQVAIMDEAGNRLPPGRQGEIVCRGPNLMRGYEEDPEENARCFTAGWFRTGDVGHLDADGYLYLTGRLTEIINRGGEKISPQEVDQALMAHPAIAQAAAFGLPHAALGEDVAAAVVLRPDAHATERQIRLFAAGRLAEFKVPRRVLIVPAIPKGPTGKLLRRGLAGQFGLLGGDPGRISPGAPRVYVAPLGPLECQLTQIWEELFGIRPIGVTDDFFALGGHSLLAVRLMDAIEDSLGMVIPPSALFAAPTVRDLARAIFAPGGGETPSRSMIAVRSGGRRPPFVLLNGDYNGASFLCRNLERGLPPEQPFYSLAVFGSDGGPIPPTIEAMADAHLETLCAAWPRGPYLLGGYSHAGLVAFELARRLLTKGAQVPLLVIGDIAAAHPALRFVRAWIEGLGRLGGSAPAQRREVFLQWRRRLAHWHEASRRLIGGQPPWGRDRTTAGARRRPRPDAPANGGDIPVPGDGWNWPLWSAYRRIVEGYVPRYYPGRVILITSAEGLASRSSDPTLGWRRVAGEVRVLSVPGDHLTCITRHVEVLAGHLRACLEEVQA